MKEIYSQGGHHFIYQHVYQTPRYTSALPSSTTYHELYKQAVELLSHRQKSHEEEISELEDIINNAGWD